LGGPTPAVTKYGKLKFIKKDKITLGMVVHAYNPSMWEAEAEDQEFQAQD
jgi:hypothetical protein